MSILDKKLALVAPFASSSNSRPALQHVRFTRKDSTVEAVATDSYTAVRIVRHDMPLASDFPIIPNSLPATDLASEILIPASVVATAGKDIPKKSSLPVLLTAALLKADGATSAEIVSTDLENVNKRAFRLCDENYPDIDTIFNGTRKNAIKVRVNAEYLAKIADMFNAFNTKGGLNAVVIELTNNPGDPIRFTAETPSHKAEVLLMTIRQ